MKKHNSLGIFYIIFSFLLVLGLLMFFPAKKKLNSYIDKASGVVAAKVYGKTKLNLTYESVSPSILSKVFIKNVALADDDGNQVLVANKINLNLNILKVLKGDLQNGISGVVVDGVEIDLDKGIKTIQYWKTTPSMMLITLEDIKKAFPYKVHIKNINLIYNEGGIDITAQLNKINLGKTYDAKFFEFDVLSKVQLKLEQKNQLFKNTFSCELGLNGSVDYDFTNARIYTSLSNITDGDFKLNKLNLLATYENKNIEVKTIQAVKPLFISLKYTAEEKKLLAEVQTKKLKPASIISTASYQKELKKISDVVLSSESTASYYLDTKKIEYSSKGAVSIPDKLFRNGIQVDYSLKGDDKKILIDKLDADGPECSARINGSYIFEKMQVSGFAEVPFFKLPNGQVISTELYFDPLETGFMFFSPQIFIGEKALTAMQFSFIPQKNAKTYDFLLEVSDYSRLDQDKPGVISINGSYLAKSHYIQTNIGLDTLFLDSMSEFAAVFVKPDIAEKIYKIKGSLSPYAFSGDMFVSSDLKTFSYNIPYILLANTQKDNQVLMLSFNGNNETLQLNQCSLVYNKYALEAAGSIEKTAKTVKNQTIQDLFFTLDINSMAVPYHLAGSSTNDFLTITGDYDLSLNIDLSKIRKKNIISGDFGFKNLPFNFNSVSCIFTGASDFSYDSENGPVLTVKSFETEITSKLDIVPKILASGSITKYGAQLNSIAYSDSYSLLEGNADVTFNMNGKVFDSANLILNLKNPISEENVFLDAMCTNPDGKKLSLAMAKESLYFSSQIQLNAINLNRIAKLNHDDNLLTASLFATGTINHPSVIMNVDKMSMLMTSDFITGHGIAMLEDKNVTIEDFEFLFAGIQFNNVKAYGSLETMTAHVEGMLNAELFDEEAHLPLYLDITDSFVTPGKLIPDSFRANLRIKDTYGDFLKKKIDLNLSGLYVNEVVTVFSEKNNIFGTYNKKGEINAKVAIDNLMNLNVDGVVKGDDIQIKVTDLNANLSEIFSYVNIDSIVQIFSGKLNGYVNITGTMQQPQMKGALKITDPVLKFPNFCPDKISGATMLATINNDEIQLVENSYTVKNRKRISLKASLFLNKWKFDHLEARIATLKNETVYGGINTSNFNVWGNLNFSLDLFYENDILDCNGKFFGENVDFTTSLNSVTGGLINVTPQKKKKEKKMKVLANVDVSLGTHSSFNFDPILRCVLTPNSKINIAVDQLSDLYQLTGTVDIKSGDIAYLNRSFYIREGSVKLNPEQMSNPQITLTAETREKDDNGENVRIILTAVNQYLRDLYPRFTSIPAKSENEIRALMGQIAIADSNQNPTEILFAAGDYALQSAVVRKAENKLRDFMNFDIISLRTNIIQNTLSMSVSGGINKGNLSLGSVLDNSTLYIGKYLGSAIYVDALLHVSFEDKFANSFTNAGNIIFKPEIGFELDSPFGNVRWNMAPDINAMLKNQFVPTSSVTLSWKWAF